MARPGPLAVAADVVTALGDGIAATFTALREGRSGVARVEAFDPTPYGADAAAPLPAGAVPPPGEGPTRVETPHGARLDRVARAVHDAARAGDLPREALGLYVAVGVVDSPAQDVEPALAASRGADGHFDLGAFFAGGFRSIHPHWPLRMLGNVVVGQLAAELDVRGDNLVLAAEADAGVRAFAEAAEALAAGAVLAALVAGVSDTLGPAALLRASMRGTPGLVLGEGAGAFVLETDASVSARGARPLGRLAGSATAFGASDAGPGPAAETLEQVARAALDEAGRRADEVGLVVVEGQSAEEAAARRALFPGRTDLAVVAPAVALGHLLAAAPAVGSAVALAALSTGEAPSTAGGRPRALARGRVALVLGSGHAGGAGALVWEGVR